jgi:hypothetical protein
MHATVFARRPRSALATGYLGSTCWLPIEKRFVAMGQIPEISLDAHTLIRGFVYGV